MPSLKGLACVSLLALAIAAPPAFRAIQRHRPALAADTDDLPCQSLNGPGESAVGHPQAAPSPQPGFIFDPGSTRHRTERSALTI